MKLADLFSNYFLVREELLELTSGLTQEQLDWIPPNHTNSIARLLGHIAETEYWWVTVLALKKVKYADGIFGRFENASTLEELIPLLRETFEDFRDYLESEEVEDWDRVYYESAEHEVRVSKRWLVWHVVEHQARHRGQILMMMRMQGVDFPDV